MFLVVKHSTKSKADCHARVVLQCERSGKPGPGTMKSKKIGCPFRLRCAEKDLNVWRIVVVDGCHNHSMGVYVEGHTTSARLTEEKIQLIEILIKSNTPKQVLSLLKLRDKSDASTLKQIYNLMYKLRLKNKEGRTVFQQFIKILKENNYLHWVRADEGNETMQDVLFIHPWSMKCLKAFPQVLGMDTTYKTNRYKQPLLEIVGFTSTWKTFVVGYAFLNSENTETFVWALKTLQSVMNQQPSVIVTDRDLVLVNAVDQVFSSFAISYVVVT